MAAGAVLAAAYAETLALLADETTAQTLAVFDALGTYGNGDAFHDQARPIVEAAAQATIDTTGGYLDASGFNPTTPSDLIVADAAARCYDPFDRLARNLARGMDFAEALAGARSQVEALGDDSVHRTARSAMAQMAGEGPFIRRLSSGCCQWCMKLSAVEFRTAGDATFGHAHCRCVPVPTGEVAIHNAAIRGGEGFDARAEHLYDQRDARRSLRKQISTARRRSEQARIEQVTEPDPVRRERLSIREQEWETRAEAAAERLRILETGSHRL
jgi:hypothetical protein